MSNLLKHALWGGTSPLKPRLLVDGDAGPLLLSWFWPTAGLARKDGTGGGSDATARRVLHVNLGQDVVR